MRNRCCIVCAYVLSLKLSLMFTFSFCRHSRFVCTVSLSVLFCKLFLSAAFIWPEGFHQCYRNGIVHTFNSVCINIYYINIR